MEGRQLPRYRADRVRLGRRRPADRRDQEEDSCSLSELQRRADDQRRPRVHWIHGRNVRGLRRHDARAALEVQRRHRLQRAADDVRGRRQAICRCPLRAEPHCAEPAQAHSGAQGPAQPDDAVGVWALSALREHRPREPTGRTPRLRHDGRETCGDGGGRGQEKASMRRRYPAIRSAGLVLALVLTLAPDARAQGESDFLAGRSKTCANCSLAAAPLKRKDLSGVELTGANLAAAVLHRARLLRAKLAGADLTNANLNKTDLKGASLAHAKLAEAMLYESDASAADFAGADLSGAKLQRSRLVRTTFDGATLKGAILTGARLD